MRSHLSGLLFAMSVMLALAAAHLDAQSASMHAGTIPWKQSEAYLYKDVIEFGGIRHADRIHDLLRLLAFQVGSEVSIAELASSLGLGRDTVDRYIDVLEKAFVVFRLRGYEFKYGGKLPKGTKGTTVPKGPFSWGGTYPASSFAVVNRDNWLDFALGRDLRTL